MELDAFHHEGQLVLAAIDRGDHQEAAARVCTLAAQVATDALKLVSLSQTTLRELRQPRLALELADAAIAASPRFGGGHSARGAALDAMGRLADAERAFAEGAEHEPRYTLLLSAGQMARNQALALPEPAAGDEDLAAKECYERALAWYRRALAAAESPVDHVEASTWIASALNDLGRHHDAITVLESVPDVAELPADQRRELELAWAISLGWVGEIERAFVHADRAVALDPEGPTFALEVRARIHARFGAPRAAAADMITRAERASHDPDLRAHCLYCAACALGEAGDDRAAFDRISEAMRTLEAAGRAVPAKVRGLRTTLLARRA